jgi:DNA-binding Xre family transcriptional regulator
MTLEELQAALKHRNLQKVSDTTELSYNTVWRIATGKAKRPAYEDIQKIKAYLEQN